MENRITELGEARPPIIVVKPCPAPANVVETTAQVGGLALGPNQQWYKVTDIRPASNANNQAVEGAPFRFFKEA